MCWKSSTYVQLVGAWEHVSEGRKCRFRIVRAYLYPYWRLIYVERACVEVGLSKFAFHPLNLSLMSLEV